MFAIHVSDKTPVGARPPAPPPYRTPTHRTGAPTKARREIDVEGCVALALVGLGCAAPVIETIARGEAFSSEATVCGVLLALSIALLVREVGRWLRARAKAPGGAGAR